MSPPLKTRRHRHRSLGIACLMTVLASAFAHASECDELATVQRQLDQVRASRLSGPG
ncbi:hypothetical protein [Erwinia tracheiphila]|uniref:hypothetical protein n=1 Tax=Erwinia tracheiphila TaxID=65700 RepID=UPI0026CA0502